MTPRPKNSSDPISLVSVNVSGLKLITFQDQSMESGIDKQPVLTPVLLYKHGVRGDSIGDKKHHGGEYKAVYSYAVEHYDYWHHISPHQQIKPGAFGENLTTQGLDERVVRSGDQFQIGEAIIEAVQPRLPCRTLNIHFKDNTLVKQFTNSKRYGIYFKVIQEGNVQVGDTVTPIKTNSDGILMLDLASAYFGETKDPEKITQILTSPLLPPDLKEAFENRLKA